MLFKIEKETKLEEFELVMHDALSHGGARTLHDFWMSFNGLKVLNQLLLVGISTLNRVWMPYSSIGGHSSALFGMAGIGMDYHSKHISVEQPD